MSEFRSILERAGNALPPSDRDFDALHRRRDRRRRTKRITAGLVAVLVAAAGTATAVTAFGPSPVQQGVGAENFYALWPEDTYAEALDAQARADAGGFEWRLDYQEFASQFTLYVFGSSPTEMSECEPGTLFCAPMPDNKSLDVRGPFGELHLNLARLVRYGEGGIWSVQAVYGERLSINAEDFPVESGHRVPVSIQGKEPVVAAYRLIDGCGGGATEAVTVRWEKGEGFIDLPALPKCRGFLLLARGVSEADIGPLASGLFEPLPSEDCRPQPNVSPKGTCRHDAITDVAALPVDFVPPQERAPSACDAPPFRPGYLPWLSEGEAVPKPRDYDDEGDHILQWDGPPIRYVSLVRHGEIIGAGVDTSGDLQVMGTPAWLQWSSGQTGVGELVLSWESASEPCGGYSLRLYDPSLNERDARVQLVLVAASLASGEPSETAYEPPPYPIPGAFAVWPEDTREEAQPIQDAADAGDDAVAWRLEPEEVARRFVTDVLQRQVVNTVSQPTHAGDGGDEVSVEDEHGRHTLVIVAQRIRHGEGGIWSVTRVVGDVEVHYFSAGYDHDRIQGRVDPGSELLIVLEYGEGDPGTRVTATADEAGDFLVDFREHFEGGVPIQDRTGHLLVGVVDPNGGYLTVFAMALPAGSWSHSQQQ